MYVLYLCYFGGDLAGLNMFEYGCPIGCLRPTPPKYLGTQSIYPARLRLVGTSVDTGIATFGSRGLEDSTLQACWRGATVFASRSLQKQCLARVDWSDRQTPGKPEGRAHPVSSQSSTRKATLRSLSHWLHGSKTASGRIPRYQLFVVRLSQWNDHEETVHCTWAVRFPSIKSV